MSDPTTPVAWGIQLSKLWLASGQNFPVSVKDIALEITRTKFDDPVRCVIPHRIAGIDGMLSKSQKNNDWCISYDENVTVPAGAPTLSCLRKTKWLMAYPTNSVHPYYGLHF